MLYIYKDIALTWCLLHSCFSLWAIITFITTIKNNKLREKRLKNMIKCQLTGVHVAVQWSGLSITSTQAQRDDPGLLAWVCARLKCVNVRRRCAGICRSAVFYVSRGEILRLKSKLVIWRWWSRVRRCAVSWRHLVLLAVSWVLSVLRQVSGERDEVYGTRRPFLLNASPGLHLNLLLSYTTAHPAEGGAEDDGETKAQDAEENL